LLWSGTGTITTVAGNGVYDYTGDGNYSTSASFRIITGVTLDAAGDIYISDFQGYCVRKVTNSNGIVTTVAGTGYSGLGTDGGEGKVATSAQVESPQGVAVDAAGNIYILEATKVRIVTKSNGIITTVAGNDIQGFSGDSGQAAAAKLLNPNTIALDATGNLYINDFGNRRFRVVTSDGVIRTFAGNGALGFNGDGQLAIQAQFQGRAIAVDATGKIFIADGLNHRIRMVTSIDQGIVSTVAGNGVRGYSGDNGKATLAQLDTPGGIAVDAFGNIYIADSNNHCIRMVTMSDGIITTVAGTCGSKGFSGDGGLPTSALLKYPASIAVDSSGRIYFSDRDNFRVRMFDSPLVPSSSPTAPPSFIPSPSPSMPPTAPPSSSPSSAPSVTPTAPPSSSPSSAPSVTPTAPPSSSPSSAPSVTPTAPPSSTASPTASPTMFQTAACNTKSPVFTPAEPSRKPITKCTAKPSKKCQCKTRPGVDKEKENE
jgi:hypothetical protein